MMQKQTCGKLDLDLDPILHFSDSCTILKTVTSTGIATGQGKATWKSVIQIEIHTFKEK